MGFSKTQKSKPDCSVEGGRALVLRHHTASCYRGRGQGINGGRGQGINGICKEQEYGSNARMYGVVLRESLRVSSEFGTESFLVPTSVTGSFVYSAVIPSLWTSCSLKLCSTCSERRHTLVHMHTGAPTSTSRLTYTLHIHLCACLVM